MTEQKIYPHLDKPPSLGDLNQTAAFLLAELHLQNELLYSALNKGAKNSPTPDNETISTLISLFRRALDDPASREDLFQFPLRSYIREDGSHCVTLLENLRASLPDQEVT
jgi:hypothetical protein